MIEKRVVQTAPAEEVEEVLVEPKKSRRRGSGKIGCCLFLFLSFLALVIWLAWLVAAAGLVTVPIISAWAYEEPRPLRQVSVGLPFEVYLSETFNTLLTQRLQTGGGQLTDRSVEIFLPEAVMTASFRSLLEQNQLSWLDLEQVQVAVGSDAVEVFLPFANSSNKNAIILSLDFGVEEGLISLRETSIKLGNLTAPAWFAKTIFTPLLGRGLDQLNQQIGRYASLKEVEERDGALRVVGELTVEIMELK